MTTVKGTRDDVDRPTKPTPRHLLSVHDLDRTRIEQIFAVAGGMDAMLRERGLTDLLANRILATHFFEQSTRTRLSFEAAMLRLGGRILGPLLEAEPRDMLPDAARVISGYADVIVVRHSSVQALAVYARYASVPVINGGNGNGAGSEHPTQALVDLYTIFKTFGRIDGLKVLVVGTMHKRVARSLVLALARFQGVHLSMLCPDEHQLFPDDERALQQCGIECQRVDSLDDGLREVDVIYHDGMAFNWQPQMPPKYMLTAEKLRSAPPHAIVLHPLPRSTASIAVDVDDTPHARYFEQAHNGLALRMAVLLSVLNVRP